MQIDTINLFSKENIKFIWIFRQKYNVSFIYKVDYFDTIIDAAILISICEILQVLSFISSFRSFNSGSFIPDEFSHSLKANFDCRTLRTGCTHLCTWYSAWAGATSWSLSRRHVHASSLNGRRTACCWCPGRARPRRIMINDDEGR